jgi:hypothetical protein
MRRRWSSRDVKRPHANETPADSLYAGAESIAALKVQGPRGGVEHSHADALGASDRGRSLRITHRDAYTRYRVKHRQHREKRSSSHYVGLAFGFRVSS